ncbi:VOC family protein [Hufsiella ginkgonis]|uniref:VOC domain-containing protein n=1 Tax=Hufsiella ginkgonis TaxID=2695274 RepID=A0A7K1XVJ7_9SPHI|nr:VOC family protein [Hufsiella ginkgonis]MXV14789.1 hypothetical protein [Hufsiella ginkgonis]
MLKVSTPILASLNEVKTIDFYTKQLGFAHRGGHAGYLIFERDGVMVHLYACSVPEVPGYTGCYFYVTDIDEWYARCQERKLVHPNGELKLMPFGLRQFAIVDNNGNIIYIAEHKEQ